MSFLTTPKMKFLLASVGVLGIAGGLSWARIANVPSQDAVRPDGNDQTSLSPVRLDPRAVILSSHEGSEPIDEQIRRMQKRIAASPKTDLSIERLGHLFIGKARLSNDPGYYKLAEQCALVLEAAQPDHPDAWLLRGHALAAMHRFSEAETIGRRLVSRREFVLDHALLGDALMEQGRLEEAVASYQQMVDLKPGLEAYTRIAHVRWLKGDLEGACEMMELAVAAGTARTPEPVAWASTRLAAFRLQAGDGAAAHRLVARALDLVPEYAPALLMKGRLLLAEGKLNDAILPLQRAAERNPVPEVQWILADALREAGQLTGAADVEQALAARGASADPRSYALYLATGRKQAAQALRLAELEFEDRRDIFTYDALAWAQWANDQSAEAKANIERALAEGTQDARLSLHAGVIAAAAGDQEAAHAHLAHARSLRPMLLPSEAALLDRHLTALRGTATAVAPLHSQQTKPKTSL